MTIGSSAAKLPLPFGSDNSGVVVAIAPAIAKGDDAVPGEGNPIGDIGVAEDCDACGSFTMFVLSDIVLSIRTIGKQTRTTL